MKSIKTLTAALLAASLFALPFVLHAADAKPAAKLKPYTLKTCIVSGEKLDGDMGKPVVYSYQDREIKFCCKNCQKDFDKDPAKYIKKIEAAEAKAKN
jgi:YHS domain-containing protein